MTSCEDPMLEQRKMFQPFVDVFHAATKWHKADDYCKHQLAQELSKACEKALQDLAQNAIDAYLATLPAKQKEPNP